MKISIKRCVLAVAIAALLPAVASAETVPLFDATPVTASGFSTNFASTFVFAESDPVTVYCVGDQTAYVKDTNGGPPLVDNYMTAGDDLKSICLGGLDTLPKGPGQMTSGTQCFAGVNSTAIGGDMRTAFNGPNVTAPVSLFDGENNLTFKLWDYGVVYGNTPLELVLPEDCSTFECWEDETAWSAGERYTTRGNWATHTDISKQSPSEPVVLYAAQNLEAGTVNFVIDGTSSVDIIITLNDGFRFALDEDNEPVFENLKIQGYKDAPSGNPRPGQFAFKSTESGKSATVTVPYFQYYGVHVDVEVGVDCPECTSEYLLEVTSVNGNTNFSHAFTLTLDSEGNLTGTGYSNYHGWEETLSDFVYELNADGEITYVSFKAVYPNAYTWYPAFQLIGGGSLLFVEVNGSDNVNSATGTWTTKEECVAN